jgi:uncharacterized cysteine cluster protein YcgN (CxxCxxCC family)
MIVRLRKLIQARREWWESLCRQCGACCYRKEWHGASLRVNWNSPCQYLDTARRRCTVYERRFQVCPDCRRMTLAHALFTSWLPAGCGYVRAFRRWPVPTVHDPRPGDVEPESGRVRV